MSEGDASADAGGTEASASAPAADSQPSVGEGADTAAATPAETSAPAAGASTEAVVDAAEDGPNEDGLYRVKVNKKEKFVTLKELRVMAQKAEAAEERFEEAARLRKEAAAREREFDGLSKRLQEDELLQAHIAGDQAQFYELLAQQLEYDNLSPEEQAKQDAEHDQRRKAKAYDKVKEEQEAQQRAVQLQADVQALGKLAATELGNVGISPEHPDFEFAVERWAGELHAANLAGAQLTPAEAAERVAGKYATVRQSGTAQLASLDGEELLAKLDELGLTDKIRRADAARIGKRPGKAPPDAAIGTKERGRERGSKVLSARDIARLSSGRLPRG